MVRTGIGIGFITHVVVLAALAATVGLSITGWIVGGVVGVTTSLILACAVIGSGATTLGPANCVTLTRAALVGGVAALVANSFVAPTPIAIMAAIAAVALTLDAVDGQVARRTATVSAVGARFDMEVDAVLILVLSVFVARTTAPWVLLMGAARYVFVACGWAFPWLRQPTPPRHWCKTVAAIQGIVLTAAVANVWTGLGLDALLAAALALLVESFGREVWWLWRHRLPGRPIVEAGRVMLAGSR